MLGLGSRAVENDITENIESHPVNTFLELLPDSQGDDPLLAVACQLLLMTIEKEIAKGEPVVTLETIVLQMVCQKVFSSSERCFWFASDGSVRIQFS